MAIQGKSFRRSIQAVESCVMQQNGGKRSTALRESGKQRRLEIIEAALRVIARDGLRAVSHRAVASEAAVPLSATTYYFRDLADLITESFLHWSSTQQAKAEAFHLRILELLENARTGSLDRARLSRRIAEVASAYIVEQVREYRSDRVLEFAFLHEAARLPRLRAVVQQQQRAFLDFLEEFHTAVGSRRPGVDAQISHSVLLGLEKIALLADDSGKIDTDSISAVLLGYLDGVLAAPVADEP